MRTVLQFGIPSLDELLGVRGFGPNPLDYDKYGIHLPPDKPGGNTSSASTSICILGPDGTGKSVIALHLASRYLADCMIAGASKTQAPEPFHVLYISTDLSFSRAERVWRNFRLYLPNERMMPFHDKARYSDFNEEQFKQKLHLELSYYQPFASIETILADSNSKMNDPNDTAPNGPFDRQDHNRSVSHYFNRKAYHTYNGPSESVTLKASLAFIDLESTTTGDDWQFVNRIIANLPNPVDETPRHLVVIDAVEGLETMVGDRTQSGQLQDRRSRIAQVMRNAAGKCHVVFVVEQPKSGEVHPEQFVADTVIHLRNVSERNYAIRTVEVEKARAQQHIRGQHPFVIRNGDSRKNGVFDYADHPIINIARNSKPQSYFHVMHSLHYRYHKDGLQSESHANVASTQGLHLKFNVLDLDNMIDNGLHMGTITALIGDEDTHKSRLGRAFLFDSFTGDTSGVGVLITTQDIAKLLTAKAEKHLQSIIGNPQSIIGNPLSIQKRIEKQIMCRCLDIHESPAATILHIIAQHVNKAKEKLKELDTNFAQQPCRIRVVIDDWSTLKQTYPDVANNTYFLPYLIHYLRQEGVSALIIDTQPGNPLHVLREEVDRELRALVDHHIYTWRVPFFGQNRIAITAPNVSNEQPAFIRELHPLFCEGSEDKLKQIKDNELLEVDPHFELYSGFEENKPYSIPLRVRLFAETDAFKAYVEETNLLFNQLFTEYTRDGSVITAVDAPFYESLREFSYLQRDTWLDHTLVFHVDEFWSESRTELLPQADYLWEVVNKNGKAIRSTDPFEVFQPSRPKKKVNEQPVPISLGEQKLLGISPDNTNQTMPVADLKDSPSEKIRVESFATKGYSYYYKDDNGKTQNLFRDNNAPIDRVPYMWDFGFLLCRYDMWEKAFNKRLVSNYGKGFNAKDTTVEDIFGSLCNKEKVSWRQFLQASVRVADAYSRQNDTGERVYPFDVEMLAYETFSCLVLEIWASEIYKREGENITRAFSKHRHDKTNLGIIELISKYEKELYLTWLLLGEAISPAQFVGRDHAFVNRKAHSCAASSRHWYATASDMCLENPTTPFVATGLPGSFSVRGDWFLAVAKRSFSGRLGRQAIDLLCSRRANITRLQAGFGLPVRDVNQTSIPFGQPPGTEIPRGELWTPLHRYDFDAKSLTNDRIHYQDILDLGAKYKEEKKDKSYYQGDDHGREDFFWLWRSTINNYDRHSRIWQKWLCHQLQSWHDWIAVDWDKGFNGFDVYDQIVIGGKPPTRFKSNEHFRKRVEQLKVTLSYATLPKPDERD